VWPAVVPVRKTKGGGFGGIPIYIPTAKLGRHLLKVRSWEIDTNVQGVEKRKRVYLEGKENERLRCETNSKLCPLSEMKKGMENGEKPSTNWKEGMNSLKGGTTGKSSSN